MPDNLPHRASQSKQPTRSAVLRLESRRAECSALLADITPGSPGRYEITGFWHRSGVSRAKGGQSCKILGVVVLFEAIHKAGGPREAAERVLAYLAGVVDALWPIADLDYLDAHITEASHDADEDYFQVRLLARLSSATPAEIRTYRDALGKQQAAGRVLLAATERLIEEREAARPWRVKPAKGWMQG